MAVRGDEPQKMQSQAVHTDFKTTQGYIRQAEVLTDGFGEPFTALPLRSVRSIVYNDLSTATESSLFSAESCVPTWTNLEQY
jgi:hypothetical protein